MAHPFISPARPWLLAALVMPVFLIGCASSQPRPTAELGSARTAVATAEEVGANEFAPLEFRSARQKLEQALTAADRGDHRTSRLLAEQAVVDAQLAEASARAARQQRAVQEIRASIDALRAEIQRSRRTAGGQSGGQ